MADRVGRVLGEERLQRPERQRVQHHANVRPVAGASVKHCQQLSDNARPLLVIGGIDVEEQRLSAMRSDLGLDLFDMSHVLAPVEVHAADVVAGGGQRQRRGFAKAAAGTQDQPPALPLVGHARRVYR